MVTTIVLTCRRAGKDFEVHYAALNNPVVGLFIGLLGYPPGHKIPYGSSLVVPTAGAESLARQSGEVRQLAGTLAAQFPALFDRTGWPSTLSQQDLNALHDSFETFERSWSPQASKAAREQFAELNRKIHLTEGLLDAQSRCGAGSKTFFSAQPDPVRTVRLSEEHYRLMDIQLKPGRLYMGYYTVGKNFLSIWRQNDLALVKANQVSPQTHANTQVVGLFAPPNASLPPDEEIRHGFIGWWQENRISQTYGYDPTDTAKLALGWFPLGELKPTSASPWPALADGFEVTSLLYY